MSDIKETLKSFPTKKISRLKTFLESSFFGVENQVKLALSFTLSHLNNELTKEDIWKAASTSPYSDSRFRSLTSKSYRAIIDFLAFEALHRNNSLKSTIGLDECVKNEYDELTPKAYRYGLGQLEKSLNKDSDWVHLKYKTELNVFRGEKHELKRVKIKVEQLNKFQHLNEVLNHYYLGERLRLLTMSLSWSGLVDTYAQPEWESELISQIENIEGDIPASIKIYRLTYHLLRDPSQEDNYYSLKKEIQENIHFFPIAQQKEILDLTRNYCLKKVNQGNESYLTELFDNYRFMLNNGIIPSKKELSPWTYKNIIGVALRLGKHTWVDEFVNLYGKYLPDDFRISGIALAKAQVAFYSKNYDQVLIQLRDVEFKEFGYNTTVKSLLLASYYELDEYDLMNDLIHSFTKYLQRHKKLSAQRKSLFSNLMKFIKKLSKVNVRNKSEIEQIKEQIISTQGLASKTWLLEKVDELLGIPSNKS